MSEKIQITGQEEFKEPYNMGEIPADVSRDWDISVNGETVDEVREARWTNDELGYEVAYGQRMEGYDGPILKERGGGGAVTMPYLYNEETGQVYVGLVEEYRPLAGGRVYNAPRGALESGEEHEEAGVRELQEESGYTAVAARMTELARGVNPNSTFFDTSGEGEGVRFYGVRVFPDELEIQADKDGSITYTFPSAIREASHADKDTEHIFSTKFVPVGEAVRSPDMFTSAAAGYLLAAMEDGRIDLIPGRESQQ